MEAAQVIEGTNGVRVMLDDTVEPYLYKTDFLLASLNSGMVEVALRTRCMQDDYGPACSVSLAAGVGRYALSPEILAVRAAYVMGKRDPLRRVTTRMLDDLAPGWASIEPPTQGEPEYIAFDAVQKTALLWPVPASAGTLKLRVWRTPDEVEQIERLNDDIPIALPDPLVLKHWVLHECYLVKDSELYDPERAAMHLEQFEARFGPRPTIQAIQQWSVSPLGRRTMIRDY